VGDLGVTPQSVAALAQMVEAGTISAGSSVPIFEAMVETGKEPQALAEDLNLIQKSDAGELEQVVDQVLADNAKAVEDVTSGGKKSKRARGFLLGQVMQKTKGQANPKVVSQILDKKLG
jgi:aspartyl-tRNA(Asn)/glutamyl-tRNA(Gln) amidotransferase subunit B